MPVLTKKSIQETHGGLLPSEVRILVHLPDVQTKPNECSAIALQYPVYAKANSPEEAILLLLQNLLDYLTVCKENGCFAPNYADDAYQVAFDYATATGIPNLDARLSKNLVNQLTRNGLATQIEPLIKIKEIISLQKAHKNVNLENLFASIAVA